MPSIITLIAEARLEEALAQLKLAPQYESDRQFQNQVIMISSRLASSQKQEMMGLIPMDAAMREKAHISQAILSIVERYDMDDAGNGTPSSPTIPPPIPKNIQREDARKLLFLASQPRNVGKLQLEKEYVNIQVHLGDKLPEFNMQVQFEPRADNLTKILLEKRPTLVHFAGHGIGEETDFNRAGIVLEDRQGNPNVVSGTALANIFRLLKKKIDIQVVFLNACESEAHARAISEHDIYAIGMTEEIPDGLAISFAGGFYLGLAESPDEVPFAFEVAIGVLKLENIEGDKIPKLFYQGEEVVF